MYPFLWSDYRFIRTDTNLAWQLLAQHGDAKDAVEILQQKVNEDDYDAAWMLGLCKEYGIGTAQDIPGAELLYTRHRFYFDHGLASKQEYGRGSGVMKLSCL